jgi:hypothetical protein
MNFKTRTMKRNVVKGNPKKLRVSAQNITAPKTSGTFPQRSPRIGFSALSLGFCERVFTKSIRESAVITNPIRKGYKPGAGFVNVPKVSFNELAAITRPIARKMTATHRSLVIFLIPLLCCRGKTSAAGKKPPGST